jgi:hypothetical protein
MKVWGRPFLQTEAGAAGDAVLRRLAQRVERARQVAVYRCLLGDDGEAAGGPMLAGADVLHGLGHVACHVLCAMGFERAQPQPRRIGLSSAMTVVRLRPLAPLNTARILSSCRFRLVGAILSFGALCHVRL